MQWTIKISINICHVSEGEGEGRVLPPYDVFCGQNKYVTLPFYKGLFIDLLILRVNQDWNDKTISLKSCSKSWLKGIDIVGFFNL